MDVKIYSWPTMDQGTRDRLFKRSEEDISDILETVRGIVGDVRQRGDQALCEHTARLEFPGSAPENLWVSEAEFAAAEAAISPEIRAALEYAINNIRTFHLAQVPKAMEMIQVRPGIVAAERWTPVDVAALYVPRGRGSFPSMLYMLAIPAVLAGVGEVIVCTPPDRDGSIDAACLVAARMIGVKRVLRAGGSQAIAALAYGTASVPKADKIIGPGSRYVAAAKRLVADVVDTGLPAGPSEAIVLADASANPLLVALDLLVEAEHGTDSQALLVTASPELAQAVKAETERLVAAIPGKRREFVEAVFANYGGIMLCASHTAAIDLVNQLATEHLSIQTRDPWADAAKVKHAGEILLGPWTPFSAANYCTGPNAVLPTGGKARTWGAVSVRDFMHATSIIQVSEGGYAELKPHTLALADYEGFYTHAQAFRGRPEPRK